MTTLNILVINCAAHDLEIVEEAVSMFRWAAEAGPLELEVASVEVDANRPLTESVHAAAWQADAVLLGGWVPTMERWLAALRESLGVHAAIQHVPSADAQDVVLVQAMAGATRAGLHRTLDDAFQIADRRERGLFYAASSIPTGEQAWHDAVAQLAPRFPRVAVEARSPTQVLADLRQRPHQLGVVVTDLELGATGFTGGAEAGGAPTRPRAWLGRRGAIYVPAPSSAAIAAGVRDRLTAAMRSAAMLLEYSAARFGLAESIRRAIDDVLPKEPHAPAGQMGQAVLETLEARFEPCAGW